MPHHKLKEQDLESSRIRSVYEKRNSKAIFDKYSLFNQGELYMMQRREEDILSLLKDNNITTAHGIDVLEIGCGRGYRLSDWLRWGADQESLFGVDLLQDFVKKAQTLLPNANLIVSGAEKLPFSSNSFDIVVQQTVFTSIKNKSLRHRIANEMLRVLRPNGLILWYDFRYPNPYNPDVTPMKRPDITKMFKGHHITFKSTTLAPPIARRLAKASFTLCRILEIIPFLRTHYLAIIKKRAPHHALQ